MSGPNAFQQAKNSPVPKNKLGITVIASPKVRVFSRLNWLCLLESVWSAHHHRQSYRYSGQRRLDHRFCGQTHCLGYCCGRGNFTVFIFMVPEYPPIIKGVKFFLRPRYYRNYISSSHFLARPMAMAICPEVIFFSMMSVFFFPTSLPFTPAMLNHLWAST